MEIKGEVVNGMHAVLATKNKSTWPTFKVCVYTEDGNGVYNSDPFHEPTETVRLALREIDNLVEHNQEQAERASRRVEELKHIKTAVLALPTDAVAEMKDAIKKQPNFGTISNKILRTVYNDGKYDEKVYQEVKTLLHRMSVLFQHGV